MTVNGKGVVGLAQVVADLVEKGLVVFLPIADTDVIDLLAVNDEGIVKRFQVKYRAKDNTGCVVVPTQSVINGKKRAIDKTRLDYFGIYCPDNRKVYYIPIADFGNKTALTLRIDEPIQRQNTMIYASDYEILK
jgi:hypothetical protein